MKINDNREAYEGSVFLGGTCASSTWRSELIGMLDESVPYFDPQVAHWTSADAEREDACKPVAGLNVFVITGDSLSTYSGFEICMEAYRDASKLVFAAIGEMPENQKKGIEKIKRELRKMGVTVCEDLVQVAQVINQHFSA